MRARNTPDRQVRTAYPSGHYYSPVVDPEQLNCDLVWPAKPEILGIDFSDSSHRAILENVFPRYMPDYDYPEHADSAATPTNFYTQKHAFSWLDSRSYFVLLRHWKPKRIIEVGSGFSTLLAGDVNRRFLNSSIDITCIEPYPLDFLRDGVPGVQKLLEQKVQDVSFVEFEQLEKGDILFIDSSHVAKTGSDVNFLYFRGITSPSFWRANSYSRYFPASRLSS